MKHIKLFESFDSIDNIEDQVWYHGRSRQMMNFSGSVNFINKDNTDEEGPGIYLTTDPDDAAGYGNYVHVVKIKPKGELIDHQDDKITERDMKNAEKIIKEFADEWELEAQNYSDDPEGGLQDFLHTTSDSSDGRVDFWQNIWYGFFRYDPKKFVMGMAANGMDGTIVPGYHGHSKGVTHAIMYNMDALEITDVIKK